MASDDEIRAGQRATWDGLSASWEKWDSVILDQLAPVGAAMIERLGIAEDQRHLDIASGTGEFVRVLRPGGRLCASVWVRPEDNPWTSILMQAIAAEVALPAPDPDAPSMFRCAAPGYVAGLYDAAGLRDVAEWDVGVELVTRSPEEYWAVMSEHVSLAAAALARVDDDARARIAAAVIARAVDYESGGAVRVPGMARAIIGTA
jgi:hypothetical protein